ncbi:Rossmann-fold NAD(P)-binding domain-containing protein [Streptacidiphilus sp. PAMC 29251]
MTSSVARSARIDWADLQGERNYSASRSYGLSKLANLMFGLELDRRSRAGSWGIVSNVAHPGATMTNLLGSGPNMGRKRPAPWEPLFKRLSRWGVFVQTVDAGLLPALYAVSSPQAQGGRLYGPDGFGQLSGAPTELAMYKSALNQADSVRLWDMSEALAGVSFGP